MSATRPVLIVTAGSVMQIALQLAFQILVARQFGLTRDVAAYEAAIPFPLVLAAILGLPLSSVLIPVMSQAQKTDGDEAAWGAATRFGLLVLIATLLLAGVLYAFAAPLVGLFYKDLRDVESLPRLLEILAWLVPTNVMTAFLQAVHNWRGHFAISAIAGVIGPGVTLAMIAARGTALTIEDVALAAVAGAVVNVLIQAPPLFGQVRWRPDIGATRRALKLLAPLLIGGIYLRIDPLIDRPIASTFDEASIACLGHSSRTINAALAIAVGGLSVVAFPRMARAVTLGPAHLGHEFSGAMRGLVTVLVPMITALALFAPEIVRDLFQRGLFTPDDTLRVALFVRCALGVVIGGSIGEIASRAFYANHDTRTPTILGVAFFTIAIGLKFLLSRSFGPAGVLVASSIAWCGCAVAQLVVLARRFGQGLFDGVPGRMAITSLGTAAACVAGKFIARPDWPYSALWGGLAGLGVYCGAMLLLIRQRDEFSPDLVPPAPPIAEESPPPIDLHTP